MYINKPQFVFFFLFVVFGATLFAYFPSVTAPFYLDDQASILNNGFLRGPLNLDDLTAAYPFRQLTYASFAMNYSLFGGAIESFHWVNIVLHCIVGISLFFFTRKLFTLTELSHHTGVIAAVVTAVFLLAPINSQSVIYTVQRGTIFVAVFYLLGMYSYLQFRSIATSGSKKAFFLLSLLLCFALGMASKQNFVTFPVACLLLEVLFVKRLPQKILMGFMSIGIGLLLLLQPLDFLLELNILARVDEILTLTTVYGRWEYFTHQLVLLWVYTYKFFYPTPLLLEYSLTPFAWEDSIVWLSLFAHLAVILFAFRFRQRLPLLLFCVLFFYLTHSLESSLFAVLPDLGFEHRTYLPNIAIALLTGLFVSFLWQKNRYVGVAVLLIQLTVGFTLIQQRSELWNDREEFYRHELKHTIDNPRPYAMVSQLFADDDRIGMATKWMRMAIQVGLEAGQLQGTLVSQYMEILYRQGRPGEANSMAIKVLNLKTNNNAKAEVLKAMARNKAKRDGCELAMGLVKRALKYSPKDHELRVLQNGCEEQLNKAD